MTFKEQIEAAIGLELAAESVDRERLTQNLLAIVEQAHKLADELCRDLNGLIGRESALTVPLADGCTVKVRFSGQITKQSLTSFVNVFKSIADNYFSSEEVSP